MPDSCFSPPSFVHQSITPHVSTVVGQGRISSLTGCVTAASPLRRPVADLHCGCVWSKEEVRLGADYAATRQMEKMSQTQPMPRSRMAQRFTGVGLKKPLTWLAYCAHPKPQHDRAVRF